MNIRKISIGLIIIILLSGCTSKIIWTDDVFAVSNSVLSWGKVDDLVIDVNDTQVSAGVSEFKPDPNAVEAVAEGVVKGILGRLGD